MTSSREFRVAPGWRRATLLMVPPLVALMGWGIYEVVSRLSSGEPGTSVWPSVFAVAICGTMALVFLAAVVWAYRARVVIDGDSMTVRGACTSTVITRERMDGFRIVSEQLNVYLTDRRFAVQIGYFERQWEIVQWVATRTHDIAAEMLAEEDRAIARDMELGMSDAAKEERLAVLRAVVRRTGWLIYAAAGVALANDWFFGHTLVDRAAVAALVLAPAFLDLTAILNRGQVRVDHEEGSRYPQIFTATIIAGAVLTLMAILDRGALLDTTEFHQLLLVAVTAKGLLWCFIDAKRLRIVRGRGGAVFAITLLALFAMPGFWAGGALYFANQHLDVSPVTWHATEIIARDKSTTRVTRYEVVLAPWEPGMPAAVEVTVRRDDYRTMRPGTAVEVGVRRGAIGVPWVAGLHVAAAPAKE